MNYLTVIPARYASTRFPGKPLALLGGKPVVQWVYEQAQKVCEHVVVATDDERIVAAVAAFKGQAIMTSATHPSGTDRCLEAAEIYREQAGIDFDVVINIQGDEPFIATAQIELLKSAFAQDKVDIATLVTPFTHTVQDILNPNNVKVTFSKSGKALYFSRSPIPYLRDIPQEKWMEHRIFYHHLGMYAYRFKVLREITELAPSDLEKAERLEQLRWLENGYTIFVGQSSQGSIGIDTPEDLSAAEALLSK